MRILQVVTLLSPDGAYGGPTRVALNQSAELMGRGHDVTVAAATRGYSVAPTTVDGVPVRLFPMRTLVPRNGFAGKGAPGLALWYRANRSQFDMVHIHFGRDLVVLPIALTARHYGIPYVLQTHGMVVPSNRLSAVPFDAMWTRKLLGDAAAVFYLNPRERAQLTDVGGADLPLRELTNGVPDYPVTASHSAVPEALFAARMQARKRPMAFVDMAKQLLDEGIDARFTLIGPDEGEGPQLRSALIDQPRISWEGALAPGAVPGRMATADVYVLPSVAEPYPMAVLEAMSVGVPVVVSSDCGLAPLVERARCGAVVDHDADSLATAVRAILRDPAQARAMGHRAREAVRSECSMHLIGNRLVDTYTNATRSPL